MESLQATRGSFGSSTMLVPASARKLRLIGETIQGVNKNCRKWNMKGEGIQFDSRKRRGRNGWTKNRIPFISTRSFPDDTETDADRDRSYQHENQDEIWANYKMSRQQTSWKNQSGSKLDLKQKIRAASIPTKDVDVTEKLVEEPLNTTDWDQRHASQFSTGAIGLPRNIDITRKPLAHSEAPRQWSPSKDTSLGRTILAIDEEVLKSKRARNKFIDFAVSTVGARFQESIPEEDQEVQAADLGTSVQGSGMEEMEIDAAAKDVKITANLAQYEVLLEQYGRAGQEPEFKIQRTNSLPPPDKEWDKVQSPSLLRWPTAQESQSDDGMEDPNKDTYRPTSSPSTGTFVSSSALGGFPIKITNQRRPRGFRPTLPRKQLFNRHLQVLADESSRSDTPSPMAHIIRSSKSHLLSDQEATASSCFNLLAQLPKSFRYYLAYNRKYRTWSVDLSSIPESQLSNIPLYIANCPVIAAHLHSGWEYGVVKPDDPLEDEEIDPHKELPQHIVDMIFDTFPRAVDAAVLLNGILLLTYVGDIDQNVERGRSPETFGGLEIVFTNTTTIMTSPPSSGTFQAGRVKRRADKMEIHLPTTPRSSNPVGSPATIRTYPGKEVRENWAVLGLHLKTIDQEPERHAATMATHAIVTEAKEQLHKEAITEDMNGIVVYRHMESIGKVTQSFDHPATEGDKMDYIYDVSLLTSDEDKHHLLPELSFKEDGETKSRMEWLDEPFSVLNHESTSQVVLLGADLLSDLRSKKRKANGLQSQKGYLGDQRMEGTVEFGPEELQRVMELGKISEESISPLLSHHDNLGFSSSPNEIAHSYQERHPSSDPSTTGFDHHTSPSESQATTIDTSGDLWYSKINPIELEGLVQGILYRERQRLSRAVLWRPDLVKPLSPFPSFAYASGCPLAVKCVEDDGTVVYKVFGFQMMQRLVPKQVRELMPQDSTNLKEKQLRMLVVNQFSCYGASILPRKLIDNWTIVWDGVGNENRRGTRTLGKDETASLERSILEPRSKKRKY